MISAFSIARSDFGRSAATLSTTLILTASLGACSSSNGDSSQAAGSAASVATEEPEAGEGGGYFEATRALHQGMARITAYESVLDASPNVRFVDDSGKDAFEGGVASDLIVVASSVEVVESAGLVFDSGQVTRVDPADPGADAVELTLLVSPGEVVSVSERSAGIDTRADMTVRVRVRSGTPTSGIEDELTNTANLIFWLYMSPESSQESPEFVVTEEGSFVGRLGDDGTIEFPALGPPPTEFLQRSFTLEDLRAATNGPRELLASEEWLAGMD